MFDKRKRPFAIAFTLLSLATASVLMAHGNRLWATSAMDSSGSSRQGVVLQGDTGFSYVSESERKALRDAANAGELDEI